MPNISHLAPILAVRDMEQSLAFYNRIGFEAGFLAENSGVKKNILTSGVKQGAIK